jgi:hypothetical protein
LIGAACAARQAERNRLTATRVRKVKRERDIGAADKGAAICLDGERHGVATGRINYEVGIGRAALGHCYARCGGGQCGRDNRFGPAAVICDRYVQVHAFTAIHDAVTIAPGARIINGDGGCIELGVAANTKALRDCSAARGIDQN